MPAPEMSFAELPDWMEQGDPWLPRKMRQYAEMAAAEAQLGPEVERLLVRLLAEARKYAGRSWAGRARWWATALAAVLFGPLTALFVARFTQEVVTITIRDRPDPQTYVGRVLDQLADTLAAWPERVQELAERELAEGGDLDVLLDINAPDRRTRQQLARLQATIDDPDTSDGVRREARARLAALRRAVEAAGREDKQWWPWVSRAVRNLVLSTLNAGTFEGSAAYAATTGEQRWKTWWSLEDGRVRRAHRHAHGQTRPVGEAFSVGGVDMRYPGDPLAPPDLVVNCRCFLLSMTTRQARTQMSLHAAQIDDEGRDVHAATQAQEGVRTAVEIHADEVPTDETPLLAAGTEAPERTTARWRGVLAPLGVRSGDNRMLAAPPEGAELETRDLPLPLLYMEKTGPGHDGSTVVGRIDRAWIENDTLMGEGVFDLDDDTARDVVRKIEGGFHKWVSVRVDKATSEYALYRGEELLDAAEFMLDGADTMSVPEDVEEVEVAKRWRLMNCAIVAEPAFQEAFITVLGEEAESEPTVAASEQDGAEFADGKKKPAAKDEDDEEDDEKDKGKPPWLKKTASGEGESFAPTQAERDKAEQSGAAMPGGRYPVRNETDLRNAIRAVGRAGGPDGDESDRAAVRRHVIKRAQALGLSKLIPDTWASDGSLKAATLGPHAPTFAALVASAGPLRPPVEWFEDPQLDGPTPLTVTEDGRIFGHAAVWGTAHVGYPGRRVTPPRGADYSRFHHGVVRTREDLDIAVGTIVLGTDHAPVDRETTVAEAMAHYAHSGFGVAVVRAGEDKHGVWINGALCPDVDELRLASLRRCSLSGDWRVVDGKPSFISALAVNVPGFPTPREQTDGQGCRTALVAAGVLMPAPQERTHVVHVEFPDAKKWAQEAFAEFATLMQRQNQEIPPEVPNPPTVAPVEQPPSKVVELADRMTAFTVANLQRRMADKAGA